MKRLTVLFVFASLIFLIFSCSTGYTSTDGVDLERYLEPESLLVLTQTPDSTIWIIDVRPENNYNNGHIPTAKNYPSGEIMDRLGELPKSQNLIFYCETGGRAQMVINQLEDKGYTRMLNWGGYTRWPYDLVTEE
jgi:rhodanese-related sulfurtransferase